MTLEYAQPQMSLLYIINEYNTHTHTHAITKLTEFL